MSFLYRTSTQFTRLAQVTQLNTIRISRTFSTTPNKMNPTFDRENISKITDAEKKITGQDNPVKGGPTAEAQSNVGQQINSDTIHDITEGEKKITGSDRPVAGGPTATAQSILSGGGGQSKSAGPHTGKLDSSTISSITEAEKDITGSERPAKGGPTAQAQKHVGENINSDNLHDITEGEKKVTGGDRVAGGPTATAQSELGKSRS